MRLGLEGGWRWRWRWGAPPPPPKTAPPYPLITRTR